MRLLDYENKMALSIDAGRLLSPSFVACPLAPACRNRLRLRLGAEATTTVDYEDKPALSGHPVGRLMSPC